MVRSAGNPVVHRPAAYAPRVLAENRRRFELLVELTRHYAGRGDAERVLRAAMLAGQYAFLAPVGLLSDVRLERAVIDAVRGPNPVRVDGGRFAGRVLHVLSEAYAVGGHTRLAWRWMSRDDRTSDVVLTNQNGVVPDQLVDAVRATGGTLHDLRAAHPQLMDRVRALREHMDRADLVVLHVHPYDSVALAAANLPGTRPPVIFENHTDQSFWLGVGGADLLCDLRPETRALDLALRGIPDERIGVLPMPVDELTSAAGEDLRRELGIRPDAVVALTVSADWKMAPCWGRGMHHLVDRVLYWSPQVSVVLVGGSPNPDWARLAKRYPGRVFPVGRVLDPAPYFALADIYLESYPIRSTTAALEAAILGLPVVTLDDIPRDDLAYILQAGSPGFAGRPAAPTPEKFAVAVRRLAVDPELRQREGAGIRAAVLAVHDGDGWRAGMEALYERARALPAVDIDDVPQSPADDRLGALVLSANSAPESIDPRALAGPLAELYDDPMRADLFAVYQRGDGTSLHLRVATGWEHEAEWATRLLGLAGTYPRLRVSLPFAADDDVAGSRTTATLVEMLTALGQTPEDCGDIHVETEGPRNAAPAVSGVLPFTREALDWLEGLLASPCWEPLPESALVAAESAAAGAA
jgi:glycosyltransferase involved in cell wall biosynthesis